MSKAGKYDGETCGGCVWRDGNSDCKNSELFEYATPCDPDFEAGECEGFRPSLQCRQVRADEARNVLLGRIADSLAIIGYSYVEEEDCAPGCRCPECG